MRGGEGKGRMRGRGRKDEGRGKLNQSEQNPLDTAVTESITVENLDMGI